MKHKTSTQTLYSFSLALILVLASFGLQPAHAQTQPVPGAASQSGISGDWWSQAQEYIRQSEYHLSWVDEPLIPGAPSSFQAPNRAQNLRFYFQEHGVQVIQRTEIEPSWLWGISLAGVGSAGELAAPQPAGLNVDANRIVYQRGELVESYANTEQGLAQAFRVASRPADQAGGRLTLALRITGDLTLHHLADGSLEFRHAGQPALHYGSLRAADARGRALMVQVASLESVVTQAGEPAYDLQLAVEDQGASYPVEVFAVISGVSPAPDWQKMGGQASAHLGVSAATAGDVNGDGYSDVIVGAPHYDHFYANDGVILVYLGASGGLPATFYRLWSGEHAGDTFGYSVATAGDVNGDGYSDVIIGAPGYESEVSQDGEGKVYVFHGSAIGLSEAWQFQLNQAGAALGQAIATAGDVNGDGYSDVIIGASHYNSYDGYVAVFYGSASGLAGSPDFPKIGWSGIHLGEAVSTAGDVNADGYADVLFSAPYQTGVNVEGGLVNIYYGSASGLSPSDFDSVNGYDYLEHFGMALSTAGDFNGDGYSDVIIGSPERSSTPGLYQGKADVFFGGSSGLNNFPGQSWYVTSQEDYSALGRSVATAGDVNGDGYADIIIGQMSYDGMGSDRGRALLWLGNSTRAAGSSTLDSADWQGTGADGSLYGCSVAAAGDVNGDGYSDIIVGAPYHTGSYTEEGRVYVYHGGPDEVDVAANWSYTGDFPGDELGFSVASAGDVNGDGYADIIAGAPYYDVGMSDEGAIFVWHGSLSGLNHLYNWWGRSGQADARLGYSVDSAGDVNGDGYDDIIAGAPFYNNGSFDEGMVFVWLGGVSGLGSPGDFSNADWRAESDSFSAALGYAVTGAGDVNGDGYADVVAGAPYYSSGHTSEGIVLGWYGEPGGLGANGYLYNVDWMYEANLNNNNLGLSLAGAGDVNRDGYSDLIAGGLGWAYVWHGSPTGLNSTWNWNSVNASAHLGASVNTAGDVNGDGYSDVIVGVPWYTGGLGVKQGAAYAFCGAAGGLGASPCWSDAGGSANAQFGASAATAGDVNGDGYADILVGAPTHSGSAAEAGSARLYYGAAYGPVSNSGGDWQVNSPTAYANLGASVASAGDINGDGYAEILIGAPGASSDSGQLQLFYGAGSPGKTIKPRQLSLSYTPLAHLGLAGSTGFVTQAFAVNPAGRGRSMLQLEIKELQNVFNGTGLTVTPWIDTQLGGGAIYLTYPSLSVAKPYHWRVRFKYSPVTSPFAPPHSRWYHLPWDGWNEVDLRAAYAQIYLPFLNK
ncbi:MAG: FG-GAP-like repeat-containing protein [Chloroflexota bacterium]